MKKYREKFEQWLSSLVRKAVADAGVEQRVGEAIEKLRYEYLPHGACWFCSMPVSRTGGYYMWKGKMFCSDQCLDKHHQQVQAPDGTLRMLDGEPVEVFKPKT